MAIGRTFPESLQKALPQPRDRAARAELPTRPRRESTRSPTDELVRRPRRPRPSGCSCSRPRCGAASTSSGSTTATGIDPWFLDQIAQIIEARAELAGRGRRRPDPRASGAGAKRHGLRRRPARLPVGHDRRGRPRRRASPHGVAVTFKTVDTCAAEFAADTPYHYSTYEDEDEVAPRRRGRRSSSSGAGRTASARASSSTTAACTPRSRSPTPGYETVMVNCNPETVSTDYDTSDRLFFEPLTVEDVRNVCDALGPRRPDARRASIVSLGGQTPLKLAHALEAAGIPVLGTSPASIDLAEDRERFNALCDALGIPQPAGGIAADAAAAAARSPPRSATRCSSGRRTCSAAGRCRSSTTPRRSTSAMAELARAGEPRPRGRAVGRAPGADRPLPRGRGRGRRRRDPRRAPARSHRRRHGAHRGGRRALRRLGVRDPAADAHRRRRRRRSSSTRGRSPTRSTSAACSTSSTR